MSVVLAVLAAYGVYLIYTSVVFKWHGFGVGPKRATASAGRRRSAAREWLVQAGLADVKVGEFVVVMGLLALVGFALGLAIFGLLPAVVFGGFAASFPIRTFRKRRDDRLLKAQEAWPRLIEEIRIQAASLGRSIPQALFDVGRRGPGDLRPAFDAAHREWMISTDFERTVGVLKERLADPTADAACETLLIAHELGGADLERRLEALADDRRRDTQNRKDARAKQAGARFARRFVLIVPLGMAMVGLTVGTGRAAYQTPVGQVGVLFAIAIIVLCWVWAGRLMKLPEERRVFAE
ncbi:MAG: type II secretion system F family protein [Acidimicrobiales bacterium]